MSDSFDVTDDDLDAPDGAELHVPERNGWFRRSGTRWTPVTIANLAPTTQATICPERKDSGPHIYDLPFGSITTCRECGAWQP